MFLLPSKIGVKGLSQMNLDKDFGTFATAYTPGET